MDTMTRSVRFCLLVLLLVTWLAGACGPPLTSVVAPAATSPAPPTEAPPETSLPTSTIVTPPSAYATQTCPERSRRDAARQATIAARATASPFPTAGPSTVQLGEPSVATARRDGLSLEVRLPKDTYLAGEGNRAEVTLRNGSPETVIVQCDREHSSWLVLLDDQGHELAPWPWTPMSGPGWNRCFGKELAPGQVLTDTLTLQIPTAPEGTGQVHALWVETRFSRSSPDTSQWSDNLWLHLAAGPIPLQIVLSSPAQRLVAELQADRKGWHLRVTGADGQSPPGPPWGFQEITSFNSASAGPLHDSPDGTWSAAWRENEWDDESEICLRTWVAAPGYVTAVVTETVPGTGDARCMPWATEPPPRQTFPSLAAAQAALAYPLYRPGFLPAGAQLEEVRVETMPYEPQGWGDAGQSYRLSDGGRLELSQQATAEPYAGFGWGAARYDPEANVVAVGQATGYAIQRFGWWQLDWKCGDAGLELRAPVEALSLEELVAVAAGVKSPDGTCPPAPTVMPPTAPPPPTPTVGEGNPLADARPGAEHRLPLA
jgi:hypothetical protein